MRYTTTLLLLTVLLLGCNGKRTKEGAERPIVTVTMEPQRYFTEAIAGDKFTVNTMVPKGSSPETYDPTPAQLVALGNSKAYLRIGYIGFEQSWMERLLENAPHLQLFDTSKGVELIFDKSHNHQAHDSSCSHNELNVEPHIWSSTRNARIIADNTYKALSRLDSKNDAYYLARHDSLYRRIEETDSIVRQLLAKPGTTKAFMIYHPALSYFARDYGLHQIAIEEGGKEPSPAQLKELIDRCKSEGVRVIFVQPEFDRNNATIIAEQTGTRVVPINPLSYHWQEELINIAKALTE